MKNIIIASTSTLHNSSYLSYLKPQLFELFKNFEEIVFVPYARPDGISHDSYTQKVQVFFKELNISVKGLHEFENPEEGLKQAKGIFVGGGNTFLLVSELYKNNIMLVLEQVVKSGTPYLGTSAGSNICGLTMGTTNDMPIVYPPSFRTLSLVSFNINPHYLDPIPNDKHQGETRETRINEFHHYNPQPVIGLREGSWLEVKNEKIILKGDLSARIFRKNELPIEVLPGYDLSNLK